MNNCDIKVNGKDLSDYLSEKKLLSGIYKITNIENQKCYVGQSIDIIRRWRTHINTYNNLHKKNYNSLIYKAIRKYGIDKFTFEVLELIDPSDIDLLNEREMYWISYFDSYNNGYNCTKGGDSTIHLNKINIGIVEEITEMLQNSDLSFDDIANIYDISNRTIRDINAGRTWTRLLDYPLRKENLEYDKTYCIDCGKEISKGCIRCVDCYRQYNETKIRPPKEVLLDLILKHTMVEIGNQYGVSDNSVRNWCKQFGLPFKVEDINNYILDNNLNIPLKGKSITLKQFEKIHGLTGLYDIDDLNKIEND